MAGATKTGETWVVDDLGYLSFRIPRTNWLLRFQKAVERFELAGSVLDQIHHGLSNGTSFAIRIGVVGQSWLVRLQPRTANGK